MNMAKLSPDINTSKHSLAMTELVAYHVSKLNFSLMLVKLEIYIIYGFTFDLFLLLLLIPLICLDQHIISMSK